MRAILPQRGQPVLALAVVLGGWTIMRIGALNDWTLPAWWWPGAGSPPPALAIGSMTGTARVASTGTSVARSVRRSTMSPAIRSAIGPRSLGPGPRDRPMPMASFAFAAPAGAMPATPGSKPDDPGPVPLVATPYSSPTGQVPQISGEAWLLLRAPGTGLSAWAPRYGGSQSGGIVRLRFGDGERQPFVYLRGSQAVGTPARDAAAGMGLRPFADVPVDLLAEVRLAEDAGQRQVRPVVGVTAQRPPRPTSGGLALSAYAQAGWVGGHQATPFADAQVLADRPFWRQGRSTLRFGLSAWAAGQRGAVRLDLGPTLSLSAPIGQGLGLRAQVDWRQRVAGNAAPGSGPALVLAATF